MSGAQLKYVRHSVAGFVVWPVAGYEVHHKHVGAMLGRNRDISHGEILSAGFVNWSGAGLPWCNGHSESLGIASRKDDTDALRAEWGMDAPAKPTAAAFTEAKAFSAALPDLPTSTQEGV